MKGVITTIVAIVFVLFCVLVIKRIVKKAYLALQAPVRLPSSIVCACRCNNNSFTSVACCAGRGDVARSRHHLVRPAAGVGALNELPSVEALSVVHVGHYRHPRVLWRLRRRRCASFSLTTCSSHADSAAPRQLRAQPGAQDRADRRCVPLAPLPPPSTFGVVLGVWLVAVDVFLPLYFANSGEPLAGRSAAVIAVHRLAHEHRISGTSRASAAPCTSLHLASCASYRTLATCGAAWSACFCWHALPRSCPWRW